MAKTNYLDQVFDTVLASPGMNQVVKINLRLSRKNILVLSRLIDQSVNAHSREDLLKLIPVDMLEELQQLPAELLKKADLTEMNEKLKSLQHMGS